MIAWWWLIVAFAAGAVVGSALFTLGVREMIARGRLIWLQWPDHEEKAK